MNADRKLNETRRAAYAGMGLCAKAAMSTHTEWADRVRTIAQDAGVEAWDLVCREYATGATGGAIVIATFTPADGDREVAVIIDRADNPDEIRAKVIAANGKAVTATGRSYRHAASPESMAKLRATVNPGGSEVSTKIAMTVLGYDQATVNPGGPNVVKADLPWCDRPMVVDADDLPPKMAAVVEAKIAAATGATGIRRYQLDKGRTGKPGDSIELVLHPDGSVTWSKA